MPKYGVWVSGVCVFVAFAFEDALDFAGGDDGRIPWGTHVDYYDGDDARPVEPLKADRRGKREAEERDTYYRGMTEDDILRAEALNTLNEPESHILDRQSYEGESRAITANLSQDALRAFDDWAGSPKF